MFTVTRQFAILNALLDLLREELLDQIWMDEPLPAIKLLPRAGSPTITTHILTVSL